MAIMWFFLGALACGSVWFVISWAGKQKNKPSIAVWVGIVLTILVGLFTIAWSWSSLLHEETQSASMGLIVFGGITILLFIITSALNKRSRSEISGDSNKEFQSQ